ncbi:proto-oncogene tyrosine-protein kinase ROS-like [Xenopus laevis]|uniref:Tyrosine-protein kinase receptor n=2 Tax=Xenopus laevis TaxID=8355 RepID=A0A1L8G8Y9_XENLA|nr:proto-oncogene tyrosine-protein kinase ROS-like [Xenopus laevis]OCT80310.1 hypothetical protein XELAEV_18027129mg [Xenopus laevis]
MHLRSWIITQCFLWTTSFHIISGGDCQNLSIIPCNIQYQIESSSCIKDYTVEPLPPFASFIGHNNITLTWPPSNISGTTYIIQWKYVHMPGEWEYTQTVEEPPFTVVNLQPYVEYWLRVVWIICRLQFYSEQSPAYWTLAFGAPASAPIIEELESPNSDIIEVSWFPPLFPNGPIIAYYLILSSAVDVQRYQSVSGRHSFQFYSTKPETTYRFSIKAVNAEGEGPASEANITTARAIIPDESPWLFLSSNNTLIKRDNLQDSVHGEAQCLLMKNRITSISINIHTQEVYFSEQNHIWVKRVNDMANTTDPNLLYTGQSSISSLSVDWLHNKIYFIMDKQVYNCELKKCTAAKKIGLSAEMNPIKMLADPFNGYLFFLLEDGIHRIILPQYSIENNLTNHIVMKNGIQDFVINAQSKRVVYTSSETFISIVSAYLDGSDAQLLREIPKNSFEEIRSFIFLNNTVMFTDGKSVFSEDFYFDRYWYNEYLVTCDLAGPIYTDYDKFVLYGESTQPFPVPSEPEQVMVLFGTQSATILWKPPKPTIESSPAAWQEWRYTVNVSENNLKMEQIFYNISSTELTVNKLNVSTKYEVIIQASSPAGKSQWTTAISGTTLHLEEEDPFLLAVGIDGIWKQPLDKFGPEILISDKFRFITDIDFYNGTLYWSNVTGHVDIWEMNSSNSAINIPDIKRAGPLAFDWIGQSIYWADQFNTMVYRKHLATAGTETVAMAQYRVNDMAVDSVNAFLYWSTDFSVESSRLSGQNHMLFQNITLFSKKQVVSLTLDIKYDHLYWIVKDGLKLNLYKSGLRKDRSTNDVAKVIEFASWSTSEISQHALTFYSDRLFWINGKKYITVQEISQPACMPFSQPAEFTAFTLIHSSLKPLPGNFSYIPSVIPDGIPSSSVKISGNYSSFVVLWERPDNVDIGTIFYCVESNKLSQLHATADGGCLTPEGFINYSYTVGGLGPYEEFDFAITPYTFWGRGPTTLLILRSPEGVPSQPLKPRIFLLQNNSISEGEKIAVELRWDNPNMTSGVLIKYTVLYRVLNQSIFSSSLTNWTSMDTAALQQSVQLYDLNPGLFLQFQVKAFTSLGPGPFSELAQTNITDVRPAPALISFNPRLLSFLDTDKKDVMWNESADEDMRAVTYTANDGKLYYILGDSLFCRHLENGSSALLLKNENLSRSYSMSADWIPRHIYVAVRAEQENNEIYVIDLEQKLKVLKLINSSHTFTILNVEAILVYSLLSRLYWVESTEMGKQISYYDISNDTVHHVLGHENKTDAFKTNACSCLINSSEIGLPVALDATNISKPCIYFLKNSTDVWASDLEGCHCWRVISINLSPGSIVTSLAVDDYYIYWSTEGKDNATIYQASKLSKSPALLQVGQGHPHILAFSTSLQPFPDKCCIVLSLNQDQPKILSATNTSFTLEMAQAKTQCTCPLIGSTTPTYTVKYRMFSEHPKALVNCLHNNCAVEEYQKNIAHILNLQPYTTYIIEVNLRNYYSFLLAQEPTGKPVTGKTDYGVPGAVAEVNLTVWSDSVINITWQEPPQPNGPLDYIRYQIMRNILPPFPASPQRKSDFPDGLLKLAFTDLHSGIIYQFMVLAFHPDENWFTESAAVYNSTFQKPAVPENIVPGNTSLLLDWKPPQEDITDFWFELKPEKNFKEEWFVPMNTSCTKGMVYMCTLIGVQPNLNYNVQAVVIFWTGATSFSDKARFKTTAGIPGKPGVPQRKQNIIEWLPVEEDNGSNVIYYILEYRKSLDDDKDELKPWLTVYNGSCPNICTWEVNEMKGTFEFRAAAANSVGLGEYSNTSERIILSKGNTDVTFIVVGIVSGILIVLLIVAFALCQKSKQKSQKKEKITAAMLEDKELMKLRGLSNAVGLANGCYAVTILPTQKEKENLPSFPREKLTLCVFLGSGAFGEVYEGTAIDILGPETGIREVAVKTLKSDATDHEKIEFLKEAHIMSQFDHPNILKLLGVCLFNEPQYIILELMDGGDLLTYLRGARANTSMQNPLLSTLDLLDISENISRGCAYLERMRFVHRDLAARNCLVSVKEYNNLSRIVKIGDFGLARDIYKCDYYRKNGEGLLPVRWMAPESLIDGIFTCRSDVWSFGIVLWEVFTMGQQPYPGFSNSEVLHHVRSGQRMDSPVNCPDDVWDLIKKCWAQDPWKRPAFSYLQKQLEKLKSYSLRCTQNTDKRMDLEGVVNSAFEDGEATLKSDGSSASLILTETKNAQGLNYVMVTT